MAGNSAILTIKIIADAANAAKGMDDTATSASKIGDGFKAAALPAAALVAGLGAMALAAADDAKSQALLATELKNATGAGDAQIAAVEAYISATSKAAGVADDELRPAFAALARGTGDITEAQKAMNIAMDVAAATGKPVEAVADAIAKGYGGSTTALSKLVPGMEKAVTAGGDMNTVMAELARMTGGASAAAADTAAGKMAKMQVAMDEAKESIGAAFLPVLEQLAPILGNVAGFIERNSAVMGPLAIVLGVVAIAILAVTAATWLFNAAMAVNPVVWIVLAIMALVAVLVIAYQKSETFREIVQTAFRFVSDGAKLFWEVIKVVFGFVVDYYQLLWEAAKKMAGFVVDAWNWIKDAAVAAWHWIEGHVIDPLVYAFQKIILWGKELQYKVEQVWDTVALAFSNAWEKIRSIFDSFIDKIKMVIEWIGKIALPDWMKDIGSSIGNFFGGGKSVPAPAVPMGRAGTHATTTSAGGGVSYSPSLQVDVYLDGQRMRGYIDRVVTNHLDDEGAAMAAHAWG